MLRKIFTGTVLFAALMVGVGHSQSNTASADMSAVLSLPISIFSGLGGIHFGGFMPGATAGTVVLPANPQESRTSTGGVVLVVNYYGLPGELMVNGEPDAGYVLQFTTDPVILTGPSEATMSVTNITTFTGSGQFLLDNNGYQEVMFGGTVNVAANQLEGGYHGTLQIPASYL